MMSRAIALLLTALPLAATASAQPPADDDGPATRPADETIVLELDSGSRLRGTIVEESDDALIFDAESLGRVTVEVDEIARRLGEGVSLKPAPADDEAPPPGILGTSILEGFDKSVSLGVSGQEGATTEISWNAAAKSEFNGPDRRWRFNSAYFFSKADGVRTQEEAFATLRRDWKFVDEPPFIFAEGRGQYDDFQAWQTRLGGFGGLGYAFLGTRDAEGGRYPAWRADDLAILGRVGAGGSYEFGTVDELVPEALVAIDVEYEIDEDKSLAFSNTLFPDLDDLGEYRNRTEVTAGLEIDRGLGLSLEAGAFNEYLSRTQGDSPHNSLTYFLRLVYDF